MAWLLYFIDEPLFRGLVVRRNADDLRDWTDRARRMYGGTGGVFTGQPAEIKFPSGAAIRTGHLKDENAYTKYQGHEYQKILIEELTHIPREKDYEALLGSCRSTIEGLKPQIFCTTNPDGAGHQWVKNRFDCEAPDGEARIYSDAESGLVKKRVFIPSRVEDNPHLMLKDPGYVAFLNSIQDPTLKKQWREGSWEDPLIEGAYYGDQMRKVLQEGRICPVPLQPGFPVDTYWDLGIGDATAIWFTQQIGQELHFIDYEEQEGEGMPFYAQLLADKEYYYGTRFMPHDAQAREIGSGKTREETAKTLGISPIKIAPKLSIDDGIHATRLLLANCWFDDNKCSEGIKALKNYRKEWDEKRATWKDKPRHDWASHGSDAMRYCAVSQNTRRGGPRVYKHGY